MNIKDIKDFVKAWNNGEFNGKDEEGAESKLIDNIQSLFDSYDKTASEIKEVKRIGNSIADEILKIRWLTWTFFPFQFRNCCTDSDLDSTIDDFNYFLAKTGFIEDKAIDNLMETITEPSTPKEMTLEEMALKELGITAEMLKTLKSAENKIAEEELDISEEELREVEEIEAKLTEEEKKEIDDFFN